MTHVRQKIRFHLGGIFSNLFGMIECNISFFFDGDITR